MSQICSATFTCASARARHAHDAEGDVCRRTEGGSGAKVAGGRAAHFAGKDEAFDKKVDTDGLLVLLREHVLGEPIRYRRLPDGAVAEDDHLVLQLLGLVLGVLHRSPAAR